MSIAKFIQSSKEALAKAIPKLEKRIEDRPYPLAELMELKSLEPDSPLAMAFGPNGRNTSVPNELFISAATQDPALYRKLDRGKRTPNNIKKLEYFKNITDSEIEDQLRQRYSLSVSALGRNQSLGGKLKWSDLIYEKDSETFEERLRYLDAELWRDVEYVIPMGNANIQTAFVEIYEQNIDKEELEPEKISPLNEDDSLEVIESEGSTINDLEEEKEPIESELGSVSSADPELPEKPEIIEDEEISELISDPINEEPSSTNTESEPVEIIETSSPEAPIESLINDDQNKAKEKQARIEAEKNRMLETQSLNEMLAGITNNINEYNSYAAENSEASSELNKLINNSNITNTSSTSKTEEGDESTSSINSTESSSSSISSSDMTSVLNGNFDFKAQGEAAIAELKKIGGIDDDDIAAAQKRIDETRLNTQSTPSELPTKKDEMELSKDSPSLPSTSTQSKTVEKQNNDTVSETKETVQVKEVKSKPQTETQSKTETSQSTPMPAVNIDLSQLDARLSRIEYALSNTLEVKVVE